MRAAATGAEAVEAYLQYGADINRVINDFCNPLVAAIFGSSPNCVDIFIQEAQVTIKPLLYKDVAAADLTETDCLEMIQVLVANGANANAVDDDLDENLVIISAAKRRRTYIIDYLLQVTDSVQGMNEIELSSLFSFHIQYIYNRFYTQKQKFQIHQSQSQANLRL